MTWKKCPTIAVRSPIPIVHR